MLSPRDDKDALIFSELAQMKFKPIQCPLLKATKQQNKSRQPSEFQRLQPTFSFSFSPNHVNKQIKYLFPLNQLYFLIGNQNQIDLIGVNGASHGFIDTQYFWSLNLKQLILNIAIDVKKCFLALVLQKSIEIYIYQDKKISQIPKIYKTIELKNKVQFIQFTKQAYLTIFYDTYFEVYIMEENGKLIKRCQKNYGITNDYKIFLVPQAVDSVLNIFFQKESNEEKKFSLCSVKVVFGLVEIKVNPIIKVYDILKSLKKKMKISNFSKDTFFLNMGCEIIAYKKGFIIDSINVNIQGQQSRLIYLSNEKLLHVDDTKVELYDIKIDTTVKPNRIKIKSIDSLELQNRPANSSLLDVVTFGKDNFGIFFQLKPQFNNYAKGKINYWFSVTQFIKKQEKIKKIFNYGMQISKLSPQIIEAKCDMARKIGLEQKDIYLEIWNRSSKSSVEDYNFLLATKDYKTIQSQIEKKLKKQSMSFRELFNIFQSCLDILTPIAYGRQQCTQQNIQEYLTCHLLVRKLKLFKEIEMYHRNDTQPKINVHSLLENSRRHEDHGIFLITIQEFYEYKNFDIKGYLIDHVNMFCHDKKNTITKIRLILRTFRFVYRVIYRQLLEEIIISSKTNLLALLQAIPQILPYVKPASQDEEISLYEGIWKDITESQWQTNLHFEKVKTLDNFQKMDEIVKSVWYKRYWLTAHDLFDLTKHQILQNHHQNVSEEIFYYFIRTIFLKIQDKRNLEVLVEFLENFYQTLPQHIRGKIFLYVDLWGYHCQNHTAAKINKLDLHEFLKLKGSDLFKFFFDLEKVKKNCILKEIKPIYLKTKSEYPGIDVFNQGLLQYFESDLSQISDLKYLLNRINNEKQQFHAANAQTYEILVQAMQIKLILGGANDIPIEEMLIYIENIPLSKDNYVMVGLQTVQRINQESQRFREMKLNMSIREIIDNCEDVISKVIKFEFRKNKLHKIKHIAELKKITYSLLAEIQTIKEKIYGDDMNNLPFFIYISQILQNYNQIELASELMHDEYLNRYFTVNEIIIENLVLYMYKKCFSKSAMFKDHAVYIEKLVTLLPENNNSRQFIINELQFALLLSAPGKGVKFPISKTHAFPKVNQLMDIVKYLPEDFILQVDIEKVYQTMRRTQEIEISNNENENDSVSDEYFDQQFITRHQVYQIFIMRMIELNLVQQVIPYIRQIIQLDFPNKQYNTLYLIMLVLKIAPQLNDDTKHGLLSLIGYAFSDKEKIIQVVDFYINTKMTQFEKGKTITKDVSNIMKGKLNYNIKSGTLFKEAFLEEISGDDEKLQQNATLLIKSTWHHLRSTRTQFRSPFYELVFIILCHQPYMLAKLIYLFLETINFKQLRSFISYISIEEIFDELKVLQFAKRIFYIVLHSRMENQEINIKMFSYEKFPLQRPVFFKDYFNLEEDVDVKLMKSLKACDKKSKIIIGPRKSRKEQRQSDSQSIHIKIHPPEKITQSSLSQYPYEDLDDDNDDEEFLSPGQKIHAKARRAKIQFDQKSERNKFMNRDGKKLGNYMKEHTKTQNASQQNTATGKNGFKIKSRIATISQRNDKQMQLKRAMTLSYLPENSRMKQIPSKISPESPQNKMVKFMDIFQPHSAVQISQQEPIPSSPTMKRKVSKRKISECISNLKIQKKEQKYSEIQKQRSSYMMKEASQLRGTETTAEMLLEDLFEDYDVQKKNFNLEKIQAREKMHGEDKQAFVDELKKLIITLYESIEVNGELKMNLIKAISTTFGCAKIEHKVLSVYMQIHSLLQRYGLNICVKRLFSVQNLFQQTSLTNLFKKSKQNIIDVSTIENLSKLSKVISLAFRKNIYEQQVAYMGLCKILNDLQEQNIEEVEVNLYFDEIHQIITKFSTKMLREKGDTQFKEINNGPIKNRLINLILTLVANKGDKLSVNALKKALNLPQKDIA